MQQSKSFQCMQRSKYSHHNNDITVFSRILVQSGFCGGGMRAFGSTVILPSPPLWTVSFSFVLFFFVLFCFVLFCFVLSCFVFFWFSDFFVLFFLCFVSLLLLCHCTTGTLLPYITLVLYCIFHYCH